METRTLRFSYLEVERTHQCHEHKRSIPYPCVIKANMKERTDITRCIGRIYLPPRICTNPARIRMRNTYVLYHTTPIRKNQQVPDSYDLLVG